MTISRKISDFVTALEKRGHVAPDYFYASCVLQFTQDKGEVKVLSGSALIQHVRDEFGSLTPSGSHSEGMWKDRAFCFVNMLAEGVSGLRWFRHGDAVGLPEALRMLRPESFPEGSMRENAKTSDLCRLILLILDGECGPEAADGALGAMSSVPGLLPRAGDYHVTPKAQEQMGFLLSQLGAMAHLALSRLGQPVPPDDAVSSFPLTLSCWRRSEAKIIAKLLREGASTRGFPMTASQSLEILAEISGKKDWNRMSAGLCKD